MVILVLWKFQDQILCKIRFKINTSLKLQSWIEFYNSCIDEPIIFCSIDFIHLFRPNCMFSSQNRVSVREDSNMHMGGNMYRWRKLIQCICGSTFANERDDPPRSGTRVFRRVRRAWRGEASGYIVRAILSCRCDTRVDLFDSLITAGGCTHTRVPERRGVQRIISPSL